MARISHADIRRAVQFSAPAARAQQPQTITLPAPVGGLNGRDALDDMKPEDAVALVNFYPGFGKVEVRKGTALWGTVGADDSGFVPATGPVATLIEFELSTGIKLVAAAGGAIYDATAGGELDTPLGDSFSNDRWQHAAMNDVLGLVNGEDTPQKYDGSTLSTMTVAAAEGEPSLTPADLIGIAVHKSRSYFWRANDPGFWFSAVNALGGNLEFFPLGDVGTTGGHLVAMTSWTRDGGEGGAGIEDLAVFVMSSGDTIVYAGSDPGEAESWSLVGVFTMGAPVGVRAVQKIGGEAVIATADGYTLLSKVLPGGRTAQGVNVSDKLGKFALDQIRASGTAFGWQIVHYPRGRRMLVNYPTSNRFEQHVVNLATGAWCIFKGMESRCWCLFGDRLLFGTAAGEIVEADTGTNDRGAEILAECRQAFSTLRAPGRNKQVNMVRPLIEATGAVTLRIGLAVDYSQNDASQVEATLGQAGGVGGVWYDAEWYDAFWAGPSETVQGWIGHGARGTAVAPSVRVEQKNDLIAFSGLTLGYQHVGII